MAFKSLIISFLVLAMNSAVAQTNDVVDAANINSESATVEVKQEEIKKEETKEKATDSTGKKKNVERIEITGSYVRRIDIEGPSPVVTINKEDFEQAGVDTVNDYLRESPLFTGSSDSGDRDGYFRFRGQHAGSTLVLINGMRIPKLGGTSSRGFYNGVENIPTNIIDRVEVLKDGSSALYGSDAMAGVMNFITKKDYDGAEYSNRINIPEIGVGLQQNHNIAFGKSYSNGSWFLSSQFVEQTGYTQQDVGSFFQTAATSRNGSNGSLTSHSGPNGQGFMGRQQFGPQCNAVDEDGRCTINDLSQRYIREPRQNLGTMLAGQIDFNADTNLNVVAMYNRRQRTDLGMVNFINLDQTTGQFIQTDRLGNNPGLQNAGDPNSQTMSLSWRPTDELGTRRVDVLQNAYTVQSQLRKYFADSWKWEIGGSYGYTLEERNHRNGLVSNPAVVQIVENGYNPLDVSASNAGALQAARVSGIEAYEASLATARFLTTGEVFDMASGPASVAIGVEGQWESTADVHDEFLTQGSFNNQFGTESGSRNVNSFFTEFVMYPVDTLEFNIAGRYDEYSDWGSTINPKVSLGFRPSKQILFRSSWGTNFNAPSVRNMIAAETFEFSNLEFNADGRREFGIPVTRYRDENLRPERGTNYNFGTVIQPNKKWTITLDQWNFEGQDTLTRFSAFNYNRAYQAFANDPNADARMAELGVDIERDPSGNLTRVRFPHVFNMGERTIRGIDIGTKFNSPIRLFGRVLKFRAGFDHTHMLVHKTQSAEVLPIFNRTDLEWKNTLSFGLSTRAHNYRLAARTLAGDTGQFTGTRTHTEYDFNYGWTIPWWTGRVQLGVKNLLNTRPPVERDDALVNFNSGFNAYAFNALGRRYYVGYSHSF